MSASQRERARENTLKILADMQEETLRYVKVVDKIIEDVSRASLPVDLLLVLREMQSHLRLQQHLLVMVNELNLDMEDRLVSILEKKDANATESRLE